MFSQSKSKHTLNTNPQAQAQSGVGIVKGNPTRCLICRNPICTGDKWTKQTSPDGAYSIILHDRCNGAHK